MHVVTLWRLQYFCCILSTTISFQIAMLIIHSISIIENKSKGKLLRKWERKKYKCTLWHYEDYNIFVVHFTHLSFLLQLFFVFYHGFILIYNCCYNQSFFIRKIKFCTIFLWTHLRNTHTGEINTEKIMITNRFVSVNQAHREYKCTL